MNKKIALITGATSGIGYEAADYLNKNGFLIYGAARRVDRLKEMESKGIKTIELDVTDENSMSNCVATIIKNEGRIDVLVNNAGYGFYGSVEDVTIEEAKKQLEVNLFGLARMTQLVLPHMRKQKFGRIINISSMGGKMYTPFGAWYHATKFAVEGFSDCLRIEVEEFGIDVVLVEPGGIKTDWGLIAAKHLKESSTEGAYAKSAEKSSQSMIKRYSGTSLSDPYIIAKAVYKGATKKRPKTRYLVGYGAKPVVFLRRILPDRIFDFIAKKI